MHRQGTDRRDDTPTARIVFRATEFCVVLANAVRNRQTELWELLAVGCGDLGISRFDNVEDYIVVGGIRLMTVALPVAGTQVDFHISHPHRSADTHFGIKEVGTGIPIMQAGVYDLHRLSPGGRQGAKGQHPMFPDVVQQLFHNAFCAISGAKIQISLEFRV